MFLENWEGVILLRKRYCLYLLKAIGKKWLMGQGLHYTICVTQRVCIQCCYVLMCSVPFSSVAQSCPTGTRSAAVHGVMKSQTQLSDFHFSLSCTGEGNGNPLQCSCLENPRDRGAWWAAVYEVAQSWTRLKWLSSSSSILICWTIRLL